MYHGAANACANMGKSTFNKYIDRHTKQTNTGYNIYVRHEFERYYEIS